MNNETHDDIALNADEWVRGADGLLERHAARIVLISPQKKVFLIRGHDQADSAHVWWFTVGGGIMPGESSRHAAIRECVEETGILLEENRLIGPVLQRNAVFHFIGHDRRQYEDFFLAFLTHSEVERVGEGAQWTDLEKEVLEDMRWFSLDELDNLLRTQAVYPRRLPEYLRSWINGWDGTCNTLEES